jgi:ribonuclease-3
MKSTVAKIEDLINELQRLIGHQFADVDLLREALTHKSFSNENPEETTACNERLEFLGDAVLDLVIGQRTFHDYPKLHEGDLTRVRAELVRERNLAEVARRINLGTYLKMGRGERRSGGENKDSLLANAVEAVFGAVFIDGGYSAAQTVIEKLFIDEIKLAANNEFDVDYKTRLQELCQRAHRQTPDYVLIDETGPDHQRHYSIEVHLHGKRVSSGEGRSKKLAEQDAAKGALAVLGY